MNGKNTWIGVLVVSALLTVALPVSGQSKAAGSAANSIAIIETSMGVIKVQLFGIKSPVTVKNFVEYANSGFYSGTIVHRVDFAICMGGYTEALTQKPTRPPIKNESKNGLKNLRGTLAMARFGPDTATSQFFINLKNNSHLDSAGGQVGYAVFGNVIEGMDVVDKIGGVKTGSVGSFSNIPLETILVKSIKIK
jgi:peptidyl-prolyl cis-trans isomerase A (cyclophilin A)